MLKVLLLLMVAACGGASGGSASAVDIQSSLGSFRTAGLGWSMTGPFSADVSAFTLIWSPGTWAPTCPIVSAKISVYTDSNRNGKEDPGENITSGTATSVTSGDFQITCVGFSYNAASQGTLRIHAEITLGAPCNTVLTTDAVVNFKSK